MISSLGARFWGLPEALGRRVNLLGGVLLSGYRLSVGRFGLSAAQASRRVLVAQIWFTGVQALVLVCSAGLLLAGVMMGVGYRTLVGFGAQRDFGDLMRLVVLTEFGPLLTALIVIGRSGTAITTELAGMRLNHEIDALEAHGVNPFAYLAVPREHWSKVWSTNPIERLNRELALRNDVVGIFPNRDSIIRLGGSLLAEQHDEWLTADKRYLPQASISRLLGGGPNPTLGDLLKEGIAV